MCREILEDKKSFAMGEVKTRAEKMDKIHVHVYTVFVSYSKTVFKGHCDERTTCDQDTFSKRCPIFPMLRNL